MTENIDLGDYSECMRAESLQLRLDSFATLWTPLSMGFSRQEYWGGLPCTPPGGLPDPGADFAYLALQADSLPLRHWGSPKLWRNGEKFEVRMKTKCKVQHLIELN